MILLMLLLPLVAAASSISDPRSVRELDAAAQRAKATLIRVRACEIQRREQIAPTLCYPETGEAKPELDSMCLNLSAKAVRLPKVDRFTSKACRSAIDQRGKDIAYARERDALR